MESILSRDLVDLIIKGGGNIIMLVVWIITWRDIHKKNSEIIERHEAQYLEIIYKHEEQYKQLILSQRDIYGEINKKYAELVDRNFRYMDQNLEYQRLLAGFLAKMEVKLDTIERHK